MLKVKVSCNLNELESLLETAKNQAKELAATLAKIDGLEIKVDTSLVND